jgi:hypothetical protein
MQENYKNEIPWKSMLCIAVHTLKLDQESFWRLTMPEFLELTLCQKSHSKLNFSHLKAELLELIHKN